MFLFLFTNLHASEDKKFDFIEDKKVKEYLKDLEKNKDRQFDFIDDKKIREFLQNKNNSFEKRKEEVEFSEFLKKLRPFIVPAIIIIWLITRSSNKSEEKPKKNTKNKNARSRTEEFIKKHNEDHQKDEMTENVKDFFEINDDKKYDDEWNYDQDELEQLRIKIEEQQVENLKVYDVEAIGMLGFTQDQVDQTKLENEEAKFTCYVFDVTDENFAKENKLGIWQGKFMNPEKWRKLN